MSTKPSGWWRRAAAATGALAIALMGALVVAQPAQAENINPTATGSITIHKHEHQTSTSIITQEPDDSGTTIGNPIEDVVFTAYRLTDIDLSTTGSDDWDTLAGLDANPDCTVAGQTRGTGQQFAATDESGISTLGELTVGAYLVCETSAPSNVVDKAQPFIVSIPHPFDDKWLYDVHVYPKNGIAGIEKSVNAQTSLGLGSTATFPVKVDIPTIESNNAHFAYFHVRDNFAASLTGAAAASVQVGATPVPVANYNVATSDSTLTVTFTNAGLNWLEGYQGDVLTVTFTATVSSVGATQNTASFKIKTDTVGVPVGPGVPTEPADIDVPPVPSDPVTTNWGDIKVLKADSNTPAVGLLGAQFEVYAANDPYAADCSTVTATGSALTVNAATTFTSTTGGALEIPGLFVSDSVNAPVSATTRCYVLREIQAPAGYVTPTGTAADTPVAVTIDTSAAGADGTIVNTQQDGWDLPLTGGSGTALLILIGSGLVLVAGGAALVNHRRKGRNATA